MKRNNFVTYFNKYNLLIPAVMLFAVLIFTGSNLLALDKQAAGAGGDSKGNKDKDVIIEAMSDEMTRSMKSLQMENMEKPYFLEYTILDHRQISMEAGFGAITGSRERHRRSLKVGLRVGDYQLDNSAFASANSRQGMMEAARSLVKEDDYNAIRHDIWLVTDKAYKEALEQFADKKAYIRNKVKSDQIPDFSREKATRLIMPLKTLMADRGQWEKKLKRLSAVFRNFPAIHQSSVEMLAEVNNKYYVNNEGTVFRVPETFVALVAYASTRTADGTLLKHHLPIYTTTLDNLPGEKVLNKKIRQMAAELTALVSAPVLEDYIGPVLFTQQASAELFAQVLVPHFSGQRPDLGDAIQMPGMATSSKLVRRINRRILPRNFSVKDDPTRHSFGETVLIGSYPIDDQGVPAGPVKLVESGSLKTLLMSRRPRKEIPNSNGHARFSSWGNTEVQCSNLFVTASDGKTYKQLKKGLLDFCKEQKMSFGLIIKMLDNPVITGADWSPSALSMGNGEAGSQVTAPVLMYRVYVEDGREELVRGITFSEVTLRDMKDIAAVGSDYYVHQRLLTGGSSLNMYAILFASRGNSAAGLPASIVAPSILFEELEFTKSGETRKNPPLLKHPFFTN